MSGARPIFPRSPRFEPDQAELARLTPCAAEYVAGILRAGHARLERIAGAQGLAFAVHLAEREEAAEEAPPTHLLKIVRNRGYPSLDVLEEASRLLSQAEISHPRLVHADPSNAVAPYGLLLFDWVPGTPCALADPRDGDALSTFARKACHALRPVHAVRVEGFGALAGELRHPTLAAWFGDLATVVSRSFGDVAERPIQLQALEEAGLVRSGFVRSTCDAVATRAREIGGPPHAVLLHGDAFPPNLIETASGGVWVDWDEARAGWWPFEVARLASFWGAEPVSRVFAETYGDEIAPRDYGLAIRLEQVRAGLRQLVMLGFEPVAPETLRPRARRIEREVNRLLATP